MISAPPALFIYFGALLKGSWCSVRIRGQIPPFSGEVSPGCFVVFGGPGPDQGNFESSSKFFGMHSACSCLCLCFSRCCVSKQCGLLGFKERYECSRVENRKIGFLELDSVPSMCSFFN